jgi:hypothetical protein
MALLLLLLLLLPTDFQSSVCTFGVLFSPRLQLQQRTHLCEDDRSTKAQR